MITTGKIRQILALVIVTATLAVAGAIALKAYRAMQFGNLIPNLPKNIDVSLQKIHYSETKGGIKKWDLVADKADFDKANDIIHLANIRLVVLGATEADNIALTADKADYMNKSKDINVQGNVVAKNGSGMMFTTGHAEYYSAKSMINTTDRVKFVNKGLTVEGRGMEFMTELKNVKVLHEVTTTYVPGKDKP